MRVVLEGAECAHLTSLKSESIIISEDGCSGWMEKGHHTQLRGTEEPSPNLQRTITQTAALARSALLTQGKLSWYYRCRFDLRLKGDLLSLLFFLTFRLGHEIKTGVLWLLVRVSQLRDHEVDRRVHAYIYCIHFQQNANGVITITSNNSKRRFRAVKSN